jgi:hypothetical protein
VVSILPSIIRSFKLDGEKRISLEGNNYLFDILFLFKILTNLKLYYLFSEFRHIMAYKELRKKNKK